MPDNVSKAKARQASKPKKARNTTAREKLRAERKLAHEKTANPANSRKQRMIQHHVQQLIKLPQKQRRHYVKNCIPTKYCYEIINAASYQIDGTFAPDEAFKPQKFKLSDF